jgi:hypothetical protein
MRGFLWIEILRRHLTSWSSASYGIHRFIGGGVVVVFSLAFQNSHVSLAESKRLRLGY